MISGEDRENIALRVKLIEIESDTNDGLIVKREFLLKARLVVSSYFDKLFWWVRLSDHLWPVSQFPV